MKPLHPLNTRLHCFTVSLLLLSAAVPLAAAEKSGGWRLAGESSPYLQMHAANPVEWYPWGAAAFDKARREGKPLFISIGYFTCHWCHVMARESFSDPAIAAQLNRDFVSIKIDREQRPDLDAAYMNYVVATRWHLFSAGSAWWPARPEAGAGAHQRAMERRCGRGTRNRRSCGCHAAPARQFRPAIKTADRRRAGNRPPRTRRSVR
jgi:hypothetical protein